ncbi:MAG TPA: PAS domain-containing protein [Candidatus Saccharimonadales bacterium]
MSKLPKLFEGNYEYLLEEVLGSIDDVFLVFNDKLSIVYANKAADNVFCSDKERLVGKNIKQLIPKTRKEYFKNIISELKTSGKRRIEATGRRGFVGLAAGGHLFYAEGELAMFKNEAAYILVLRDITLRKAVEDELQMALMNLRKIGTKIAYRLEHPRIMENFPID